MNPENYNGAGQLIAPDKGNSPVCVVSDRLPKGCQEFTGGKWVLVVHGPITDERADLWPKGWHPARAPMLPARGPVFRPSGANRLVEHIGSGFYDVLALAVIRSEHPTAMWAQVEHSGPDGRTGPALFAVVDGECVGAVMCLANTETS